MNWFKRIFSEKDKYEVTQKRVVSNGKIILETYIGKDIFRHHEFSGSTKDQIDKEANKTIEEAKSFRLHHFPILSSNGSK